MMIRLVLILFLVLLSACSEKTTSAPEAGEPAGKPRVVASNYPLYFFTREIAGNAVDVDLPEFEGDPAMWVPGPADIAKMQTADLIILNGAGYESWLAYTTLPSDLLVDTTADIQSSLLPIENPGLHQHGPVGEHSHEGTAFTSWLDPQIAIEQARSIETALALLVPADSDNFHKRLGALEKMLTDLDQSLAQAFSGLADQPLVFSHPVYQYLQQRYALNGRSLHWEPEIEPGVKQWIDFQNLLAEHPAKLIIWEQRPLQATTERLQAQGIQSIVFDPVANQPATGDYFSMMNGNLEQLSGLESR